MSAHLHPSQEDLQEAHGTPQEYAEWCWRACTRSLITNDEAVKAIEDYSAVFAAAAGDCSAGRQTERPGRSRSP
jgi:hypothetical protein